MSRIADAGLEDGQRGRIEIAISSLQYAETGLGIGHRSDRGGGLGLGHGGEQGCQGDEEHQRGAEQLLVRQEHRGTMPHSSEVRNGIGWPYHSHSVFAVR